MTASKPRHRLGHRLFVLGFIAAPLVVLALLIQAILFSFETGPSMVAEPVGAGAGDTGGANAVGGSLFGAGDSGPTIPSEATARGAELIIQDASGLATAERPVLVLTNHARWEADAALPTRPGPDGLWRIRLPAPPPGVAEPLAFRFAVRDAGGAILRETDEAGDPVGDRRLPRVPEAQAVGEEPLVYRFTVEQFE